MQKITLPTTILCKKTDTTNIPLVYTVHTRTHTHPYTNLQIFLKKEFKPEVDDDFGKMKEQRKLKSS